MDANGGAIVSKTLFKIGIALIEQGAGPETTSWILELLKSADCAQLPLPVLLVDQGRAALHFAVGGRALAVLAPRPNVTWWHRIYPDGSHDQGQLGARSEQTIADLFDWLFGQMPTHV
jgi:hypothetical protein